MKTRPIPFTGPMILAIQNTKPGVWPAEAINPARPFKWQTRRAIDKVPHFEHYGRDIMDWSESGIYADDDGRFWLDVQTDVDRNGHTEIFPRHGVPGDHLWVRETWWHYTQPQLQQEMVGFADGTVKLRRGATVLTTPAKEHFLYGAAWKHKPYIFLPRWASRFALELKRVRVERVQAISEEDAIAEGACIHENPKCPLGAGRFMYACEPGNHCNWELRARDAYRNLWDSINGKKHPWDSNPWVWVYDFMRVQ